jgi:hypothetical protein
MVQTAPATVRLLVMVNKDVVWVKHVLCAQRPVQERDVRCSTQSCLQTATKNDGIAPPLRKPPHNHTEPATHVRKQQTLARLTSVSHAQA